MSCLSLRVEMSGVSLSASSSASCMAQRRAVSTSACERPARKRPTTREATSCRDTKAQPPRSSTRRVATRSGTCSKGTCNSQETPHSMVIETPLSCLELPHHQGGHLVPRYKSPAGPQQHAPRRH